MKNKKNNTKTKSAQKRETKRQHQKPSKERRTAKQKRKRKTRKHHIETKIKTRFARPALGAMRPAIGTAGWNMSSHSTVGPSGGQSRSTGTLGVAVSLGGSGGFASSLAAGRHRVPPNGGTPRVLVMGMSDPAGIRVFESQRSCSSRLL